MCIHVPVVYRICHYVSISFIQCNILYVIDVSFSFCWFIFIGRTKFSQVLKNRNISKHRKLSLLKQHGFMSSMENVILMKIVHIANGISVL